MYVTPQLGLVVLVAASIFYASGLARVRAADRAIPDRTATETVWWFGYFRDLTNAAGLAGYFLGLWLAGLPGPLALFGAFWLALIAYALDYVIARALKAPWAQIVVSAALVALVVPTYLLRASIAEGLREIVEALFTASDLRRERS